MFGVVCFKWANPGSLQQLQVTRLIAYDSLRSWCRRAVAFHYLWCRHGLARPFHSGPHEVFARPHNLLMYSSCAAHPPPTDPTLIHMLHALTPSQALHIPLFRNPVIPPQPSQPIFRHQLSTPNFQNYPENDPKGFARCRRPFASSR